MSSSEEEQTHIISKKGAKKSDKKQQSVDYKIKPSTGGPSMDTSNWPLLLKVKPNIILFSYSHPFLEL